MTQRVGRVMVRRHEVDGQPTGRAELEKFFNPSIAGRRRSADFERLVDPLNRLRGYPIQPEVILLSAGPERFQIGLVPHLEEPGPDFLDAVSIDPVPYQPANQR